MYKNETNSSCKINKTKDNAHIKKELIYFRNGYFTLTRSPKHCQTLLSILR